ncbi:MAG: deoxyguanosinetriphosphate triphosphohydrolase [Candidatus Muproteobacteria bacterium RIFCSPHIGHO2_01_FULL_65_16]|uniref:Deoxyguanosinetriphosphate triphosphohydrolase-like protein n=1 Tax=Candidatus Muproteobacteria bacterium RIFCSPHIGHO2_01_FULL_65_16 TaxID=1817764 RepID=A0A1F6TJS9_9PROT|nr:MAG: deoxyguanosinetriphosphate triphosphohydrolase [Candidatus Muproteobacteria bacterium RIFCSPHIGHO2_01_FULL_65_16]
MLAPYAATDAASRGRAYPEPAPAYRGEFQRDRDRVIHCAAFRRLEYKTQVFVNHEGDLFRTRLTHSIEVAQIGRSIARALGLNEDLTEAIALAHDLGHTPFGHSGQDALNDCMQDYGGFEHNLQSLRVVDVLEERYAEFPGLNLTYETREGVLKHCAPKNAAALGELGRRFLEHRQPGLEAQLANIADEIAYNNHDVDDGLRSGLITAGQLRSVALFAEPHDEVARRHPGLDARRHVYETIRRMINRVVTDVIETSRRLIADSGANSIEDVRHRPAPLIAYSTGMREKTRELKHFLRDNLYAHELVSRTTHGAKKIIHELFAAFLRDTRLLPTQYQDKIRAHASGDGVAVARIAADYIAGMTDRYAYREHARITGQDVA